MQVVPGMSQTALHDSRVEREIVRVWKRQDLFPGKKIGSNKNRPHPHRHSTFERGMADKSGISIATIRF